MFSRHSLESSVDVKSSSVTTDDSHGAFFMCSSSTPTKIKINLFLIDGVTVQLITKFPG